MGCPTLVKVAPALLAMVGCDACGSQHRLPSTSAAAAPAQSRPEPSAGVSQSAAASELKTICYGAAKLTEEQRHELQNQYDQGTDRCPGLRAPEVAIDARGVAVQGQQLSTQAPLPDPRELAKIEPLARRLELYRKRWQSFFPNEPFQGKATIQAAVSTPSAVAVSAIVTTWSSGYATARVETGGKVVELSTSSPIPRTSKRNR